MGYLLKNGFVYLNKGWSKSSLYIDDKGITHVDYPSFIKENDEVIDCTNLTIMPGFVDLHVHLREPGFEYKETIELGTLSAAKGGYTTLFAMPNLNPVPDSVKNLKVQLELINQKAHINVNPYASITLGQTGRSDLVDLDALSQYVKGFSDDGKGVQNQETMRLAMQKAAKNNRVIVAHCEDESLLAKGGCVHDGEFAKKHGLVGISSASEFKQIERDLALAKETGASYHVCHISCKESVDLVRNAKKEGVHVSCEVTPHHLLLNENDIVFDDGNYKMNPPLRTKEDQKALIEGILDGTIDCIATDHAPHSEQEKSKGLAHSAMGIIGSELAFSLIYTHLVKQGILNLKQCIELMSEHPANIFGLNEGVILDNHINNLCVFDLNQSYQVTKESIVSKGKNTPFINQELYGVCKLTFIGSKICYREGI